jgi:hypothetical protein
MEIDPTDDLAPVPSATLEPIAEPPSPVVDPSYVPLTKFSAAQVWRCPAPIPAAGALPVAVSLYVANDAKNVNDEDSLHSIPAPLELVTVLDPDIQMVTLLRTALKGDTLLIEIADSSSVTAAFWIKIPFNVADPLIATRSLLPSVT